MPEAGMVGGLGGGGSKNVCVVQRSVGGKRGRVKNSACVCYGKCVLGREWCGPLREGLAKTSCGTREMRHSTVQAHHM